MAAYSHKRSSASHFRTYPRKQDNVSRLHTHAGCIVLPGAVWCKDPWWAHSSTTWCRPCAERRCTPDGSITPAAPCTSRLPAPTLTSSPPRHMVCHLPSKSPSQSERMECFRSSLRYSAGKKRIILAWRRTLSNHGKEKPVFFDTFLPTAIAILSFSCLGRFFIYWWSELEPQRPHTASLGQYHVTSVAILNEVIFFTDL